MELLPSVSAPQLIIHKQDSIATEQNLNGASSAQQQQVHVVVKNSPFHLQCEVLSPADGPDYSLTVNPDMRLKVQLLYDDNREKEVEYIKEAPMTWKMVESDSQQRGAFKLEVRIKVLTSQHGGMLFRLRLQLTDASGAVRATALSPPTKAISKKDLVTRPGRRRSGLLAAAAANVYGVSEEGSAPAAVVIPGTAMPLEQALAELEQLQQQTHERSRLLHNEQVRLTRLLAAAQLMPPPPSSAAPIDTTLQSLLQGWAALPPAARLARARHAAGRVRGTAAWPAAASLLRSATPGLRHMRQLARAWNPPPPPASDTLRASAGSALQALLGGS